MLRWALFFCISFLCGPFQSQLFSMPIRKEREDISQLIGVLNNQEWGAYKEQILLKQSKCDGWCSKEKADYLMELIRQIRPSLSVEIGVFSGKSLLPLAAAIKFYKTGKIYGIDPWSAKSSAEGYSADDLNAIWWKSIDYETHYKSVVKWIKTEKLEGYCFILRVPAHKAAVNFADNSIDFLHVDGNHAAEIIFRDVQDYDPKIAPGGYVLVSDANWASSEQALNYLFNSEHYEMCWSLSSNEYILFHKLAGGK